MKRYPDRVHRAVLTGFVPLDYRTPLYHAMNAQRVIDLLLFKCQSDSECSAKYPHLRSEWEAVARDHHGPFAEALRAYLGTAAAQRQLPSMIHSGNFDGMMRKGGSPFAEGMYLTIACSEGVSRIADADVPIHRRNIRRRLSRAAGDGLRARTGRCIASAPIFTRRRRRRRARRRDGQRRPARLCAAVLLDESCVKEMRPPAFK